jgi:hypothetical protein
MQDADVYKWAENTLKEHQPYAKIFGTFCFALGRSCAVRFHPHETIMLIKDCDMSRLGEIPTIPESISFIIATGSCKELFSRDGSIIFYIAQSFRLEEKSSICGKAIHMHGYGSKDDSTKDESGRIVVKKGASLKITDTDGDYQVTFDRDFEMNSVIFEDNSLTLVGIDGGSKEITVFDDYHYAG